MHRVSPVLVSFKPTKRSDITGSNTLGYLLMVSVHFNNFSYPLSFSFGSVINICSGGQRSGIHLSKINFADKRIAGYFKTQSGKRRFIISDNLFKFTGIRISTFYRWHIKRRRKIIFYRI